APPSLISRSHSRGSMKLRTARCLFASALRSALVAGFCLAAASGQETVPPFSAELDARIDALFAGLPPVQVHHAGLSAEQVAAWQRRATGPVREQRVEFGWQAASVAWAARASYRQQRDLQRAAHEILSARNAAGKFDAQSQWEAWRQGVDAGRVGPDVLPLRAA